SYVTVLVIIKECIIIVKVHYIQTISFWNARITIKRLNLYDLNYRVGFDKQDRNYWCAYRT
ncbi:MAG: hypothetical protein QN785_09945, partial [Nitrososphaeraceae archaeon]|nr:hypothetical protein [Nitrososphaeraceae archaeon]